MSGLQRFERRLENAVSGVFARAFRSAVQPVEIVSALIRECDNNAHVLSRDRRLVPNDFHVELAPSDLERLAPYDSALAEEVAREVSEHATTQHYVFPGPVKISFEAADDLSTGRFRVRSEAQAKVTGFSTDTQFRRAKVVLVVNGHEHPLNPPSVVVGRGSDADLRINDPGISRRHAEFIVTEAPDVDPIIEVHDMGSTNGIRIRGRKVPRGRLNDGDTVRIGNTSITVKVSADV